MVVRFGREIGHLDVEDLGGIAVTTAIHRFVSYARTGELPRVVCKLKSGWVVLGETQVLRGYCLLLPDPVVTTLNDLIGADRLQYLSDMTSVGDALLKRTNCVRVNYEILGNLEPALHAHIIPRYNEEAEELRTKPIWSYDWTKSPAFDSERDDDLLRALRSEISLC